MELTLDSALSPGAMVGHVSYGLLILSMLMTRMAWLRLFAIASGLVGLTYDAFWLLDPVGLFWESAFVLTNVGQLAILTYRNRTATFTADERAFFELAVPELEPSEVRRLLAHGRWVDAAPGTIVTRENEPVDDLVFLVAGRVEVKVGDHVVGGCEPGHFIGEISVSTGGPASATAIVAEPSRYLAFESGPMRALLDKGGADGRAMEAAFRHGLREKLIRTNEAMVALGTANGGGGAAAPQG